MIEIWGSIDGYPNYMISSHGLVKSIQREVNHGNYKKIMPETILKNKKHPTGYRRITLTSGKSKKSFLIHRLVAFAFIENIDGKPHVNHKDGNRTNNNVENLEWVTVSENHTHAFRVLNKKHPRHQLGMTGELCKHSRKVYCATLGMTFSSKKEAGEKLGIGGTSLGKACNNKLLHVRGLVFNYLP